MVTHHLKNLTLNISILIYLTLNLQAKAKQYVNKFIKIEEKYPSDLIEIHNRPNYLSDIVKTLGKKNLVLYFHNDPLTMTGSKSINERKFLLKNCYKIIFNSNWSKKDFWKECMINLLIVKNSL